MAVRERAPAPLPVAPLTVREVAETLKVTDATVREWLRAGKIRGSKLSGTAKDRWRVPLSEVERLTA